MKDLVLDQKTNLVLSGKDRLSNIFISGYPSSGIATYLCKLISQDTVSRTPCLVLDPYGDLKESIENNLSEADKTNIMFYKVGDKLKNLSLNIFNIKGISDSQKAQSVIDLFIDLYDPNRQGIIGPRFEQAIRNAVLLLLVDDAPDFHKLSEIFIDPEYVRSLLPKVNNDLVKSYWLKHLEQISDLQKSEINNYILTKFTPLLTDEVIKNVIEGNDNVPFEEYFSEGKTVIFDLGNVSADRQKYTVITTLIMSYIEKYIFSKSKNQKLVLYLDEVQMLNSKRLSKISELGKRVGLSLTFVTSRIGKLNNDILYEVSRFGTKVSFRQMGEDIEVSEKLFVQDELNHIKTSTMKRFHAYIQTLKDGEIQPIVVIET
ncbi:MAG: hypothetical protein U0525_03500 [Patescibacteria group bacterium]